VILSTCIASQKIKPSTFTKEKAPRGTMVYTSIPAYIDPANWQQQVKKLKPSSIWFFLI